MDPRTGSLRPPGEHGSPLAPVNPFPERTPTMYERKAGPNMPGGRGPMRFEEGVATDTDVPDDFTAGALQGMVTSPGRYNRNAKVDTKYPEETIAQRYHVGSASWVQAPEFLGEFAGGAFSPNAEQRYQMDVRDGLSYRRDNPANVWD